MTSSGTTRSSRRSPRAVSNWSAMPTGGGYLTERSPDTGRGSRAPTGRADRPRRRPTPRRHTIARGVAPWSGGAVRPWDGRTSEAVSPRALAIGPVAERLAVPEVPLRVNGSGGSDVRSSSIKSEAGQPSLRIDAAAAHVAQDSTPGECPSPSRGRTAAVDDPGNASRSTGLRVCTGVASGQWRAHDRAAVLGPCCPRPCGVPAGLRLRAERRTPRGELIATAFGARVGTATGILTA